MTGSTQGLGLAIARRLASAGCDIVLHGLGDPGAGAELQRQIETESEVRCMFSPADLRNPAAIEHLMSMARETLGPIDILVTCNAVCPGTSATPLHEASLHSLSQTQNLERDAGERIFLAGKQPTGRLIAPGGVAALVVSLCSPETRDITGAAIPIDGGWSAM